MLSWLLRSFTVLQHILLQQAMLQWEHTELRQQRLYVLRLRQYMVRNELLVVHLGRQDDGLLRLRDQQPNRLQQWRHESLHLLLHRRLRASEGDCRYP